MARDFGAYDVVVAGGGPSGVMAALAAARAGAKVLLVERNSFLGGNLTLGLPILTYHDSTGRQIVKGIPDELIDILKERDASPGHLKRPRSHFGATLTPIDSEIVKSVLLEMVYEAGIDLLLYTVPIAPIMEGSRVTGLRMLGKAGELFCHAKMVVDATGDGDILAQTGAPMRTRLSPKGTQPATLMFQLGNVDLDVVAEVMNEEFIYGRKAGESSESVVCIQGNFGAWDDKVEAEGLFADKRHAIWFTSIRRGFADINVTRILAVDPSDPRDLTRAEMEGRRQMHRVIEFLRKYVKGFEDAFLVHAAPFVGLRDSRHIVGRSQLTQQIVMSGERPEDVIAYGSYAKDIHDPAGEGITLDAVCPTGYGIPLSACIPMTVSGVLACGRTLDADEQAFASVRVMATLMAVGQGVGVAAALSAQSGLAPSELGDKLHQVLTEQNAFIGP